MFNRKDERCANFIRTRKSYRLSLCEGGSINGNKSATLKQLFHYYFVQGANTYMLIFVPRNMFENNICCINEFKSIKCYNVRYTWFSIR